VRLPTLRRELEAEASPASALVARPPFRFPVVRTGTALEVAEVAWNAEGVGREAALTIPAVAACRDLVVGTAIACRPYRYRGDERLEPEWLLSRPDPSMTWAATLAGTIDELLFYGRAYWRVLDRDSEGFIRRARWTPFRDVTPETRSSGGSYSVLVGYRIAGLEGVVAPSDVVRFDGVQASVLETGARTLAIALELEGAARRFAAVELPAGVITNTGTELGEDEAETFLARFAERRRQYGLAFLQGLEYERADLSPADLGLLDARYHVVTEVARLFGVPVSEIDGSVSGHTGSMTYGNLTQRRAALIGSAVAPHLAVVEQTLTDVVPRGQAVAFDVQAFIRSDPAAAADYVVALLEAGLIDKVEARSMLGIPSSSSGPPDLTPGRV